MATSRSGRGTKRPLRRKPPSVISRWRCGPSLPASRVWIETTTPTEWEISKIRRSTGTAGTNLRYLPRSPDPLFRATRAYAPSAATLACKFVILEFSTSLRRRMWRGRAVEPDETIWDQLSDGAPRGGAERNPGLTIC